MANSQHQYGEWQTPDKGEWVQSLEFVADHQDQLQSLVTFGHSFCSNRSLDKRAEIVCLDDLGRREARYLRVRLLYTERCDFQVPQSDAEEEKAQRPLCYPINRLVVLGTPTLSTEKVRNLVITLQKQNTIDVFTNLFQLAKKKGTIFQNIAASKPLIDSFASAYDRLLPAIIKQPRSFIPTFVGIAACNDDFCDKLIQGRLNCIEAAEFSYAGNLTSKKEFDVLMDLISELILIKSDRQGSRFQIVLDFLFQQFKAQAFGAEAKDDICTELNMKLVSVLAKCSTQIVEEFRLRQMFKIANKKNQQKLHVKFSEANLVSVLKLGRQLRKNLSYVRAITSLVGVLMNLQAPFVNEEKISIEHILQNELKIDSMSESAREEAENDKTYEIFMLSVLFSSNVDNVQHRLSFDSTILYVVANLDAYVKAQLSSNASKDLKNVFESTKQTFDTFQISIKDMNIDNTLKTTCALSFVQVLYNLSRGEKIVQTQDQRTILVRKLYSLLCLAEASELNQARMAESEDNQQELICFVDVIPEIITEAIVATIKLNINGNTELQNLIAKLLQQDIEHLESLQQKNTGSKVYTLSPKFTNLVIEPLFKFKNTQQVIVNKAHADKDVIEPFYCGNDGTQFNASPLQSQLLTDKYLDLFYELFDRQKNKTGIKKNKKTAFNSNWCQLCHFGVDDLNQSTFADVVAKMSGQKNLLFIFEFIADKEKHLCIYFTFGQVDQPTQDKRNKRENQSHKTAVLSQVGDFMLIGSQEQSKVAVIPDLQNVKQYHSNSAAEHFAIVIEKTFKMAKGAASVKPESEGRVQLGVVGQEQPFLSLSFVDKKFCHASYLQAQYLYKFQWVFPAQFQKMNESEFENAFYNGTVKFSEMEIWQWKTDGETSMADKEKNSQEDKAHQSQDFNQSEIFDDLLADSSRNQSKRCHMYQSMSPYNILRQNLVFDVPKETTLEQLQLILQIDFTYNFMQRSRVHKNLDSHMHKASSELVQLIDSDQEHEIPLPLDTKIGDLVRDLNTDGILELLVSDKKRLPGLTKGASHLIRQTTFAFAESSTDLINYKCGSQLPIVQMMAARGGIQKLVQSALQTLHSDYCDQSIAMIWINFLTLYTNFFAPLPGFESRFFTEERLDLIIKILTKSFDLKTSTKTAKDEDQKSNENKSKIPINVNVCIGGEETIEFASDEDNNYEVVINGQQTEVLPLSTVFPTVLPTLKSPSTPHLFQADNLKPSGWPLTKNQSTTQLTDKNQSLANNTQQQDTPEHQRQRSLSEHHRKAAFDMTRLMFEEELTAFKALEESEPSSQLRFTKICLQQNFFSCILDQLSDLTRNSARTRVSYTQRCESDDDGSLLGEDDDIKIWAPIYDHAATKNTLKIAEIKTKPKTKKKKAKKKFKKKMGYGGIGYTSGVGKTWDVNAYIKNQKAKNEQIIKLINVMQMVADACSDMQTSAESADQKRLLSEEDEMNVQKLFLESALLPIIESALRSGSILEMAKEFDLYSAFLHIVETFGKKKALIHLLSDIGPEYQPRQRDSIFKLLKKAAEMSNVFQDCLQLTPETSDPWLEKQDQTEDPKKLSDRFLQVFHFISNTLQQQNIQEETKSLEQILQMPLTKAYFELCSQYRLKKVSLRVNGNLSGPYDHHYAGSEASSQNPSSRKLIRLAQEIADLTESLPCEVSNSVFTIVDKQRVDFMKCVIMGSAGTPYAHGAFVYDIYFDDGYPDGPPKINLSTTGGGLIRFNPNLYNCGKVCLSLLGTWRGSSTENWNPKVSTLLQVILSIQAIIMSNEVYFNEPNYEHLMGTDQGEKLNNGYANIVRYGTLKYAIIEQLKKPTHGFEDVIRRNFFLKKDMILAEVDSWIERDKTEEANYSDGLTTSHNNITALLLSETPTSYRDKMIELRKELLAEFAKLNSPFTSESVNNVTIAAATEETSTKKPDEKEKQEPIEEPAMVVKAAEQQQNSLAQEQAQLDQIDVSYAATNPDEESKTVMALNVDDEGVKDRWSRYIGAMGIEAVAKQAEAVVYIDQLGGLGIEIAKNIVLAGCKELILGMTAAPTYFDLSSQFFIDEKDVKAGTKQSRVALCKQKLQELNPYVKVTALQNPNSHSVTALVKRGVRVAIFTDPLKAGYSNSYLSNKGELFRNQGIQVIVADQCGVFSRIITDLGPSHIVIDKDGEEIQPVMIQKVVPFANEDPSAGIQIEVLQGARHSFEDGSIVILNEIIGMKNTSSEDKEIPESINGQSFKVKKVIDTTKFVIDCDSSLYTPYERDGIAKQVKTRQTISFAPLKDVLSSRDGTFFDENLNMLDFCKLENFGWSAQLFKIKGDVTSSKQFQEKITAQAQLIEDYEEKERFKKLALAFQTGFECSIGPLCACIGGIVAQEIVKAITRKFMPIKQEMYLDIMELYEESKLDADDDSKSTDCNNRYVSLSKCFGDSFLEKVKNSKIFMIGAGAIGCELLKNFAMVGLGTGPQGQITLTDPDSIELSNLNRQFLFREKHLSKPKSMTAAAAVIQMNPELKGHVSARLDKIHKDTDHIYTEEFFKSQTVVANALDNVAARIFIDQKCVNARVPMLDSGTLGAKGHVQVVIPFKTESYGSAKDPDETNEIPHCTLKHFPEETLHCVEWAKDLLGSIFEVTPQNFNKLKSTPLEEIGFQNFSEVKNIQKAIKVAQKCPQSFEDCITLAVRKFYKLYRDSILQLILAYPLDKLNPDGRPFWSLPKRQPQVQSFDSTDPLHRSFVAAYACLTALMYNVKIPHSEPRSDEAKSQIADFARTVEVPPFVPNTEKARAIQSQVEKEQSKNDDEAETDQTQEEETKESATVIITTKESEKKNESLETQFTVTVQQMVQKSLLVQEFEKDDDQNFHVDFIYASANVRASNYSLEPMDWIQVKLKAGRIVPALATTTAAIAGLQTIELLKLLKRDELALEKYKNTFLNLAVPIMQMIEPGASIFSEIKPGMNVDIWTRWDLEISQKTTLGQIVNKLQKQFHLSVRDVMYQATTLFFYALREHGLSIKQQPQMKQTISALLQECVGSDILAEQGYVDLTITFVDPDAAPDSTQDDATNEESPPTEKILKNVPTVRIYTKSIGHIYKGQPA